MLITSEFCRSWADYARRMSQSRARCTGIHPIIPVDDVRAALTHYRALGFRVRSYSDDYGFAVRGQAELHLTRRGSSFYDDGAIAVLYLDVDDADALFAEWSAAGIAGTTEAPGDMPWGMREGIHRDPDGNIIRFGSPR
jgi:catechol 2,3-dioxygenase-like lactoylglutathione lyase family enzyme